MRIQSSVFTNSVQVMDGGEFIACEFHNCIIEFGGKSAFKTDNCRFVGCKYKFTGNSQMVIDQMRAVYHGLPNGKEFVESVFEAIRAG